MMFESVPDHNQSIKFLAPIPLPKPGSMVRQLNQCSTAKSKNQFRSINGSLGMPVSMRERPSQKDVSSDIFFLGQKLK